MKEIDESQKYYEKIMQVYNLATETLAITTQELDKLDRSEGGLAEVDRTPRYFVLLAYESYLKRIIVIVEDSFNAKVDTFSILAIVRHIFELRVWCRVIASSGDGGWIYYGKLLKDKLKYWSSYENFLKKEAEFYDDLEKLERNLSNEFHKKLQKIGDEKEMVEYFKRHHRDAELKVDEKADEEFTIYGSNGRENTYGFTAWKLRKDIIPPIVSNIQTIRQKKSEFDLKMNADVIRKVNSRWNWRDAAISVGLEKDYDFIYAFTSGILHAGASSTTARQERLMISEYSFLIKYFFIAVKDMVQTIKNSPAIPQQSQ